jgi:hypothetical protein
MHQAFIMLFLVVYRNCQYISQVHLLLGVLPIIVLVVNCQSIKNKKQELENLVETSKPDIMIGTESWLSNDIQSTEIFPSGFTPYRKED